MQKEYFNFPSQTLTLNQAKDSLITLAMDVLEKSNKLGSGPKSKVFGELRDKIDNKKGSDGSTNGGNDATWDVKYTSQSLSPTTRSRKNGFAG